MAKVKKRTDGLYQKQITIGRNADGSYKRKTVYGKTQKELDEKIGELIHLYCADCGSKLHYNINHPNNAIEYFNCSNYRGNRGTCNETHYIRADSLEQVVLLELNRMACYLRDNEEAFAKLLAQKTTKDYELEQKQHQQKLRELTARNAEVDILFERVYEEI